MRKQDGISVAAIFVVAHIGLEGFAGKQADEGDPVFLYVFSIMLFLIAVVWILRTRRSWFTFLLLFIPVVGGFLCDEMAEEFTEKRRWLSLLGLLVFCGVWLAISLQFETPAPVPAVTQHGTAEPRADACRNFSSKPLCDAHPECGWVNLTGIADGCVTRWDKP
jgi:hypothetical protein